MAGMVHSNLPVFYGKDFDDWCVKMEAIFGYQEVDDIVKKGFKEPLKNDMEDVKKEYKENKRLDCKARMLLHQCISATIFQKVSKAVTAKELWDILQEGYGNSGKVKTIRLQSLQRQYELLCMGENETIAEYIGRIQIVANAMRACDKIVKDKKMVEKILRTLTPQYDHIVVAIEECKDLDKMKIEELQNSLEAHEQRLIERRNAEKNVAQGTNQALQARSNQSFKNRGRGRGRSRGGRSGGRNSKFSDQNSDSNGGEQKNGSWRGGRHSSGRGRKGYDKRNVQCFTCRKYGHYSSECWHNEDTKKTKIGESANLAQETEESESDHVVLMSTVERFGKRQCEKLTLNRCKQEMVSVDRCNEAHVSIIEEGGEQVSSSDETRHADNEASAHALLSNDVNQAANDDSCSWYLDTGCSNHMTGRREWLVNLDSSIKSCVRFADNSTIRAEGIGRVLISCKDGKITYMDDVLYVPTMKSNLLSLGQLLEKGYTMSMHQKHIEVFDSKQRPVIKAPLARNRTFKVNLNATAIQCLSSLNHEEERWLWHFRYGHLNFKSLSQLKGKELVKGVPLIIVPDRICESCVVGKQPRRKFEKVAPRRSKQSLDVIHSDIRVFRTDGGGEFNSVEMDKFCTDKGIVHEVTAPYTPQHNGLAERRNRMILDMTRCMLKAKKLSHCLWGEVVSTAVYLLNRSPTKALSECTPEEAWSGIKPTVYHLRIFGSVCYKHVPDERRRKLDDKSETLILVGYHPTGAYRLYNPEKKQIVISRDVIVDEAAMFDWEKAEAKSEVGYVPSWLEDKSSSNAEQCKP
ncbi:uncharacterized protein LOC128193958 [Vigna angularis]|uniref:uncharacterized protein LOC128193958 n=1 Tax=Phaseolus angularis TaxID=3914 RepID=UPI0022B4FA66|nr:uncharacterized protein LOC128193958 [Vigna angularis]